LWGWNIPRFKIMAEIQLTFTATISVTLTLPDAKLKPFLEGDIDITSYLHIQNSDVSKDHRGFTIDDCGIEIEDLDTSDVESIEKSNGVSYEWDGEKLKKA
jgi:hypothetical protein